MHKSQVAWFATLTNRVWKLAVQYFWLRRQYRSLKLQEEYYFVLVKIHLTLVTLPRFFYLQPQIVWIGQILLTRLSSISLHNVRTERSTTVKALLATGEQDTVKMCDLRHHDSCWVCQKRYASFGSSFLSVTLYVKLAKDSRCQAIVKAEAKKGPQVSHHLRTTKASCLVCLLYLHLCRNFSSHACTCVWAQISKQTVGLPVCVRAIGLSLSLEVVTLLLFESLAPELLESSLLLNWAASRVRFPVLSLTLAKTPGWNVTLLSSQSQRDT